tara:strand:+ start:34579 stop:37305 length:2727 start_codon:yes stop_codon:yes gene_type:complete
MDNGKKLFLLDGYALIYRAYFAFIKNPRINSDGLNTSAVFGFANTLLEVIRKQKPSHIAVAFDTKHPTERHDEYPQYKANRDAMPEGLSESLPYIFKLLEAFNIKVLLKKGYEADDIIGTIAKSEEKKGFQVYMMTSDKDFAQLVSDNIFMYRPATKWEGTSVWGVSEVLEKFQVHKINQVIDFLAMMGDSADNIPGIPGVGKKTAQKFIKEFGSVEGLLDNVSQIKGKLKEKIESSRDLAILCKKLVTINTSVPISYETDNMKLKDVDEKKIRDLFEELEFNQLLKRVLTSKKEVENFDSKTSQQQFNPNKSQISLFSNETKQNQTKLNTKYVRVQSIEQLTSIDEQISTYNKFSIYILKSTDLFELPLGYAIGLQSGETFYFDFNKQNNKFLKQICERENIEIVAYDIKYIAKKLRLLEINLVGKLFDISIAHYLMFPDMRRSLELLSNQYLNVNISQEKQISLTEISDRTIEYCCKNVDLIYKLAIILEEKLRDNNIISLYNNIEIPLTLVLSKMEINGIKLDVSYLQKLETELTTSLSTLTEQIYSITGKEFNIASPKQTGEILFEKLNLSKKPKKTKSGQYSTSEETLFKLKGTHPIIDKLLEFRSMNKLQTTYVSSLPKLLSSRTKKIHTTFNQTVASTGRLSSVNPNLQNIPIRTPQGMKVRKAFVASNNNYSILCADYSQIELRIMAAFSGDTEMLKAFNNGIDIHSATAAKVYNVNVDEVDKTMRTNAKSVNFGIIYGISAFGLAQNLGISRNEAKNIIEEYFIQFPAIKKYMDSIILKAREQEYVETYYMRRRYLPNINSRNAVIRSLAERNAINAPIQGTAADIIKIAMVEIQKELNKQRMQSKMILQVHDELVFDMFNDEKNKLISLVKSKMEHVVDIGVPLIVDIGQGENWLQAH